MGKQFKEKTNKSIGKIVAVKQQEKIPKAKVQETAKLAKSKQEENYEKKPKIQNRQTNEGKIISKQKRPKKEGSLKGKKNRIIIRNLVFDINEKHIKKLFLPYGQIIDVQVPKNANNQKLNKGFAFIEYKSHRSCQKAMKELNKSLYKGRNIILDYSISKMRFMTGKLDQKEQTQNNQIEQQIQKQEEEAIQEEDIQGDIQEEVEQQVQNNEQANNKQEQLRKQRQLQDLTSTLFIRNLPLNINEQTLRQFFSKYGKVKWARIVIDKQTKTPKGTAFVRYFKSQITQKLIQYSKSLQLSVLGKNASFKHDPKYTLQIDGTILKVFPVEKREAITEKIKQRNEWDEKKKIKLKPLKKIKRISDLIVYDKEGKRKLHLADYGLWQPTQDMTEQDIIRFKNHSREKIEKLKNPNNSLSDVRIILKYLDKNIQESQIKDLVLQFLNTNKIHHKQMTYCKLMLDQDRKKSAGYAFLEFRHHQNAKMFVQNLAQNYQALQKRPFVVEFAIQDSRKLQKLSNKGKK